LPPTPPIAVDDELLELLSGANFALGRLDASAEILPNPDLFVGMYVRKEAVLSSQIEGTQASLTDILEFEALRTSRGGSDVAQVVNYVQAVNYGLARLPNIPISNRLIREIHKVLLTGVRGEDKSPGEFRRTQNWIAGGGNDISDAIFVPPPPIEVQNAMNNLEAYIHRQDSTPVLIKAGLIHSQFESIHPFLDGNGRMGRLLITFYLCERRVLARPILYLSAYLKQHRQTYYDSLQRVRDSGDWEQWLKFFLTAIRDVAGEASGSAHEIVLMRERHRQQVQEQMGGSLHALQLLDYLFQNPYVAVSTAADRLDVSFPTANSLVSNLVDEGLLTEITGRQRDRVFAYSSYIELLSKGTELPSPA